MSAVTRWAWLAALMIACSSTEPKQVPTQGVIGGPCYPNGTCDVNLSCFSNLCVNARITDGGGGSQGTGAAATGTDASGPAQGAVGGPCYPNSTCNSPLSCFSNLCVDARKTDGGGGSSSSGGATGTGGSGPAQGTVGGPCYPNSSCNSGLSCFSNLCVDARITDGGGGSSGGGGATGSGGTAPTQGTVGGPCYPNSTCNSPFSCFSNLCVDARSTGGATGAGGGSGLDASSGGGTSSGGSTSAGGSSSAGGAANPDGGTAPDGAPYGGEGGLPPPFTCGSRDVTFAKDLSGTISGSAYWSGVYHVVADLSIRNQAVIRIAPGTKFIVAPGVKIEVAALANQPTLIADGTAQAPIEFCGEAGTPGYWSGIIMYNTTQPASMLRHVLVADAGTSTLGAALTLNAPILVDDLRVLNSNSIGLRAVDFAASSQGLVVSGASSTGVEVTSARAVNNFPPGSTLKGNGKDVIQLGFTSMSESVTFAPQGVPYYQPGSIGSTLTSSVFTFNAGVDYWLPAGRVLGLSGNVVVSQGTASDPVVFECPPPCNPGTGGQVSIGGGSTLTQTRFSGLGYGVTGTYSTTYNPALIASGATPITLDGVWIGAGIPGGLQTSAPFSTGSKGIVVTQQASGYPSIGQPCINLTGEKALFTLPLDTSTCSLTGPGNISGTGTIRNLGVPYQFQGSLYLTSTANVSIDPGTHLQFLPVAQLNVASGGTLSALGTAALPVTFELVPGGLYTVNAWGGMFVSSSSVVLDNVVVKQGGNPSTFESRKANIVALSPFTLTNSQITGSRGWGLLKTSTDTTDYAMTNTYSLNTSGDIGTLP